MVARQTICLRQLAAGERAREVAFGRFLANARVTAARLLEGWSEPTKAAVAERHVLAIQDTSEINFATTPSRRRGLGEIGKGVGRGVLLHAMVAVDACSGACLGLVAGAAYTRDKGRVSVPHRERLLQDKESHRWIATAQAAKPVLARAAHVTIIGDRESDLYAAWAMVPDANVDLLTRVMQDRAVVSGGTLAGVAAALPFVDTATIHLPATHKRLGRVARLSLRFAAVEVRRSHQLDARGLAKSVALTLVDVIERDPPTGVEPVHWRLLTTHGVADPAAAWQIVGWYRQRWTIEQMFRLMKTQGLRLETSQLADAAGLIKLAIVAAKAATVILQLTQARDGTTGEPACLVFTEPEQVALDAVQARLEGKAAPRNPHRARSLAWAGWIIARLGGWDGHPSSRAPGPITFCRGLQYFRAIAEGWTLRDVCMP